MNDEVNTIVSEVENTAANLEAAITQAINPTSMPIANMDFLTAKNAANAYPLSTDPIPPVHHINLIDNIADITDYINEQTQKHKELMVHIESFKDKLTEVSADMKNYHVEDKFASVKKLIVKEETAFLGLTTARKIELGVVILVGAAIISALVKFL